MLSFLDLPITTDFFIEDGCLYLNDKKRILISEDELSDFIKSMRSRILEMKEFDENFYREMFSEFYGYTLTARKIINKLKKIVKDNKTENNNENNE